MILGEIYDVAEAKGREAERAAIVAWLREDAHQMKVAACVAQDRVLPHETIADAISRGDHLPGGGE